MFLEISAVALTLVTRFDLNFKKIWSTPSFSTKTASNCHQALGQIITHGWHPSLVCFSRLVSGLVIISQLSYSLPFPRLASGWAMSSLEIGRVGWDCSTIRRESPPGFVSLSFSLQRNKNGKRLLCHPEGESTRFCFTFIFTAKYQNGEDYFVLSLSQEKDYPVIPKQSPAGLRIRSSFHLSRLWSLPSEKWNPYEQLALTMIVCIEKVTISGLTSNRTLIFPLWWRPKTNLTLLTPSPSSCCPGSLAMKILSLVFQNCLESGISSSRPSLSELNRLLEKEGVDLEVEERR